MGERVAIVHGGDFADCMAIAFIEFAIPTSKEGVFVGNQNVRQGSLLVRLVMAKQSRESLPMVAIYWIGVIIYVSAELR